MSRRQKAEGSVDWSKVPVVIVGTPNQEALRALWEDVVSSQLLAVSDQPVVERVSLVSVPSSTE